MTERRRPAHPRLAIVTLALLAGTGCSWIVSRRPPPGPVDPHAPLACTVDYAAPVLDTVGAGFFGLSGLITTVAGTAYAAGACPSCYTGSKVAPVALGVAALAGTVVFALSANHGYRVTEACQAVEEQRDACLSGVEASCAALRERGPPGPPAPPAPPVTP
jgi:hypothetical protein